MFDYPVLQILFAVYFMLILAGFVTAIGWCNPSEYRRRPVLFGLSIVFTAFGVYALARVTAICSYALSPGDNLMTSATNIFTAFYENLSLSDYTKYASDQVGALVLSGIVIVFLIVAFLLSFVFTFTFFFRIALKIDLKLRNSVRYIIMACCIVLTAVVGIITSQTLIMALFLIYAIVSLIFLIIGNLRLINYNKKGSTKEKRLAERQRRAALAEKQAQEEKKQGEQEEAKAFFGESAVTDDGLEEDEDDTGEDDGSDDDFKFDF